MTGKAFEEGKKDHGRGLPQTACAYEPGTPEFIQWNEGWGEAMSVAAYVSAPAVGGSHKKPDPDQPAARLLGIL